MSTQQSINNCVSRIEAHLNSKNPDLNIVHTELRFLDSLGALARNGIEVDTSEPKEEAANIDVKFTKGSVLVIMQNSGNLEEQRDKILDHLRKDVDWKSDNYGISFDDNPSEAYHEFLSKNPVSKSSKYTLHSGEMAYLIKI